MASPLVLVLDFDGVIVDLDIDWAKVRREVSLAVGRKISSMNEFWRDSFGTDEFLTGSKIAERYELDAISEIKQQKITEISRALETARAPPSPTVCYVASLQSEAVLNAFFGRNGLSNFFVEVLGRCSYGSKKSQLEHIRKLHNDSRVIMIDDSGPVQGICEELGIEYVRFRSKDDLGSMMSSVLISR
jgi:phosphoglycolate phosphatase-like HAD superfamily hydrolase